MEIIIVTGMSGAGKTEALKCLEDLGYYAIDNLPSSLLLNVVDLSMAPEKKLEQVALGIDIRGGRSFEDLFKALDELEERGIRYTIIFMDASDEVLVRRFSATRRMHPLVGDGLLVGDTIAEERRLLDRLRERAGVVVDTSDLNIYEVRDKLKEIVPDGSQPSAMRITLISFGFKYGIPLDADIVFDARFLPNPYWVEGLRELSGHESQVADYVFDHAEASEFVERLTALIEYLLPFYLKERKAHLNVAVGCTGGRHRSVAIVDQLAVRLRGSGGQINIAHRDIEKR